VEEKANAEARSARRSAEKRVLRDSGGGWILRDGGQRGAPTQREDAGVKPALQRKKAGKACGLSRFSVVVVVFVDLVENVRVCGAG
jgi:hypothetical protein